ncbi:MAG: hypothetical protein FJY53_03130 [Betaproteobacteria bacterium]|nr:hypothetical protein [Betaproteobacteria bacterium]
MIKSALIHYKIRWKPTGNQPGAKRGVSAGIGDQLRALVLLRDHPDPRRIDLRASMRDPFEQIWVRDFNLNTSLKVIALVDASASMGYQGAVSRFAVTEEITSQLALSAYRSGDAFGFYAANSAVIKQYMLPPKVNRSAWLWVKQHLSKIELSGNNADGLLNVSSLLPKQRCLVFVISDFRWAKDRARKLFQALNHHDVVPIILQDPHEFNHMPTRGIATMQDMETGTSQFVWMRSALKEKIVKARSEHLKTLQDTCRIYGYKPFLVRGQFQPEYLTQYFLERNA